MPAGNLQSRRQLTPEARKHLLLVACTIDRIDLASSVQRVPAPMRLLAGLTELPWFDFAASLATRFIPRRAQFLVSLWRAWRKRRR